MIPNQFQLFVVNDDLSGHNPSAITTEFYLWKIIEISSIGGLIESKENTTYWNIFLISCSQNLTGGHGIYVMSVI